MDRYVLCTGPGTQILLAHVRRWKSDARFFQTLRKALFNLVDAECSMESPRVDLTDLKEKWSLSD